MANFKINPYTSKLDLVLDLQEQDIYDARYLKLDQSTPQTFTAGTVTGTGLLSVTAGVLGLNTTSYLSTALNSANIFVGNSSNIATGVALSGDAALSNTGVLGVNKTRLNVRNETGVTIASTKAVYASGFNNVPLISLSDNTDEAKHDVIGITVAPIAHEANGFIATTGQCDAETNSWNVGDALYLSTAGALTNVMPTSGAVKLVGIVTVKENYPVGKILIAERQEENILAGGANTDLILRMGDSAGTNKASFRDYANNEVAYVNSDGAVSAVSYGIGATTLSSLVKLYTFESLANAAGWLHNDGAGVLAYSTPTAADVGALPDSTVLPANEAGAANNFLTAYNSGTGAWTKAQPTWANIDKTTSDIADITTKSHTSLSDIGTLTHATIDSYLDQAVKTTDTPQFLRLGIGAAADADDELYVKLGSVEFNATADVYSQISSGAYIVTRTTDTNPALQTYISAGGVREANPKYVVSISGKNSWGAGGASAVDTNLYRSAANTLKTDDALVVTGHCTFEGVTSTGATGTGKFVFDNTPTLITPVLGVATGSSLALSESTTGISLTVTNTNSSAAGARGAGALFLENDGAAMASGDRLGFLLMGGSSSAVATRNSAGMVAYASENWVNGSAYGTKLDFETIPNGSTTRSAAISIGGDQTATFAGSLIIPDANRVGFAGNKAHIQFDDEAVDTISMMYANIGVGTTTPAPFVAGSTCLDFTSTNNMEMIFDHTDAGVGSVLGDVNFARADTLLAQVRGAIDGAKDAAYLSFSTQPTGGAVTERMRITSKGNVTIGNAALATSATDGFLYIPTCAGTPTGTPTAYTGRVAMVFDTTNNKAYIYDGGWIALN